jgi:hypothetical protein
MPDSGVAIDRLMDFSAFDFEIEKRPIYHETKTQRGDPDFEKIDNRFALVRKDTDHVLGVHSNSYHPVPYGKTLEALMEVVRSSSLDLGDVRVRDEVADHGKRMYRKIEFRRNLIEPKVGDYVSFTLDIGNSYDGSKRFSYRGGSMRLWCLNGAMVIGFTYGYSTKHTRVEMEAPNASKLEAALQAFYMSQTAMQQWLKRPAYGEKVEHLFKTTLAYAPTDKNPVNFNKVQFEDLMKRWDNAAKDEGANAWAVYNAATSWATHPQLGRGHTRSGLDLSWDRNKQVDDMIQSEPWKELIAA